MLVHSIKASRPLLARTGLKPPPRSRITSPSRTLLTATAVRRADMIQEMYLQELRRYKPPPVKPSDAEGHVQKFTAPKTPPSPEERNIASDLKAYEEQQVEVEGQASQAEGSGASTAAAAEHDWFEDEDEENEEGGEGITPSGH